MPSTGYRPVNLAIIVLNTDATQFFDGWNVLAPSTGTKWRLDFVPMFFN